MRDGPHPYETAGHARRVLASVALAATGSPAEAAGRFEALGLATNPVGKCQVHTDEGIGVEFPT